MRLLGGFVAGCMVGLWVGVIGTCLVYEAVGRRLTLPGKIVVPDFAPEALEVTW